MATDYRINYLTKNAVNETYKLEIQGDKFVFKGEAGTVLEMKPILPRTIEVDQGETVMVVTKNRMLVKNKTEKTKKLEQTKMNLES